MSLKKTYIKCADERRRAFCRITTIAEDRDTGERQVWKEAVWPEGTERLKRMIQHPSILNPVYPHIQCCPVRVDGDRLVFDYLDGQILLDQYIAAFENRDRKTCGEMIRRHRDLMMTAESNQKTFEPTENFEEWFGDPSPYAGKNGLRVSNIDGTAGNILFRHGKAFFIDYEWVMDFSMPEDLVLWYGIQDIWNHIGELEAFCSPEEAAAEAGIRTDIAVLENSRKHFFAQIIKDPDGTSFAEVKAGAARELTTQEDLSKKMRSMQGDLQKTCMERDDWRNRYHLIHDSRAWSMYRKIKKVLPFKSRSK